MDKPGKYSMASPSVGIFTPVYNRLEYVVEFFRSVLSQTVLPQQVVVVDNGNPTNISLGLDLFRADFEARGIEYKLIKVPINIGGALGYNLALTQLTTDIATFASGDDVFVESRIEQLLAAHDEGFAFVHSAFQYFGNGSALIRSTPDLYRLHLGMLFKNIIGIPTVSIDTRIIPKQNISLFQHRRGAEDYALWCHLLGQGIEPHYIDEVLMLYRIHAGQDSALFDYKASSVLMDIQREWFSTLFGLKAGFFRETILHVAMQEIQQLAPASLALDNSIIRVIKEILEEHSDSAPKGIAASVRKFARFFST